MLQSCASVFMKTWNAGSEVFERRYLLLRHAPDIFQNGSRECKVSASTLFRFPCARDWSKPAPSSGSAELNDVFIEHAAKPTLRTLLIDASHPVISLIEERTNSLMTRGASLAQCNQQRVESGKLSTTYDYDRSGDSR